MKAMDRKDRARLAQQKRAQNKKMYPDFTITFTDPRDGKERLFELKHDTLPQFWFIENKKNYTGFHTSPAGAIKELRRALCLETGSTLSYEEYIEKFGERNRDFTKAFLKAIILFSEVYSSAIQD